MNLAKAPPLPQKRIVEFVNNFAISTVSFLDKFSNNCEIHLQRLDARLKKVEAELSILEAKLNSEPSLKASPAGFYTTNVPTQATVKPSPVSSNRNPASEVGVTASTHVEPATPSTTSDQTVETQPAESSSANDTPSEPTNEEKPKEIPEELKRFYKMVQFGVPAQAVRLKMTAEGFDPELLQL